MDLNTYQQISKGWVTNGINDFELDFYELLRREKVLNKVNDLLKINEVDMVFDFVVHRKRGFPKITTIKMIVDKKFEFNSENHPNSLIILRNDGKEDFFAPLTLCQNFDFDMDRKYGCLKVDEGKLIKAFIDKKGKPYQLPDFGMKKTNDQIYKEYLMSKIASGMPDPVQKMKSKKI